MYIVESNFKYKGYQCITTFGDMGHRCGYVGLPKDHPLYGMRYDDKLNVTYNDIESNSMGKRSPIQIFSLIGSEPEDKISLSFYFDVHGGITYVDGGKDSKYPIESDLWWLGFDCGHAGDGKDLDLVEHLWGDDERIKLGLKFEREFQLNFPDDVIRTREYVVEECKSLVEQIEDLINKYYVKDKVKNDNA